MSDDDLNELFTDLPTRDCPNCGAAYEAGAVVCRCGEVIPDHATEDTEDAA